MDFTSYVDGARYRGDTEDSYQSKNHSRTVVICTGVLDKNSFRTPLYTALFPTSICIP